MTLVKVLTPLVVCCALLVVSCAVRHVHDYTFSIAGVVTDEDGAPIQDAQVSLELSDPVYSGVTPVKTAQITTNSTGGFVIMNITHERSVKYTITVLKNGFIHRLFRAAVPPKNATRIP